MCGRFESKDIEKIIEDLFSSMNLKLFIDEDISHRSKEDIKPTEKILSVILKSDIYHLKKVNWGIKFKEDSPLIFNSRIETIKEKVYWNKLLANNKCIIPMTAFYEWKKEGKKKTKYRVYLPDENLFFVPAVFVKDKEENISASLITTVPNNFIKQIHHRMPVILDLNSAIKFLNDDVENSIDKCVPYDDKKEMDMEIA